jgi:TRAP-type C4-dicarboxylate transport system substrate-binding protein
VHLNACGEDFMVKRCLRACATAAILLMLGAAVGEASAETTMRVSHERDAGTWGATLIEEWGRDVEAATHGVVKVQITPQMFKTPEHYPAVRDGKIEAAFSDGHDFALQVAPELGVLLRPYSFADREAAGRFFGSPLATELASDVSRKGIRHLGWLSIGSMTCFPTTGPVVSTPTDFSGKRIRSFTEYLAPSLRAVGAEPVVLSGATAIIAGLRDGTLFTMLTGCSPLGKLGDVVKTVSVAPMETVFAVLYVNPTWWDALPGDVQRAIVETTRQYQVISAARAWQADEQALKALDSSGVRIHRFSDVENNAIRAVFARAFDDAFRKRVGGDADRLLEQVDALGANMK